MDPVLDPRRAGRVRRYHTWPVVREQTIAEHGWQVARIVMAFAPDAAPVLIHHCLFHDVGEVAAGDAPYPSKANDRPFAAAHERLETDAHLRMTVPWGLPPPAKLDAAERDLFRLAHWVEMWEWALDEIALGNHNARPVARRMRTEMDTCLDRMPAEVRTRAVPYITRRERAHGEVVGSPSRSLTPDITGQKHPFGYDPAEDTV